MRKPSIKLASLALPLLAAGVLALVATPSAFAGAFHGVVPQGSLAASDYELMGRGNAGTLRLPVNWSQIQPSASTPPSAWNWGSLDGVVDAAAANGVKVLPALQGPSPSGVSDPPRDASSRGAFARFAAALADRYGQRIKTYQIYNEQNGPTYWGARPNARRYGKLLKAAAKAITREDGRAEIVLGGMFGTPSGRGAIDSWDFLSKLYRMRGIKKRFDTVAIHPYSPNLFGIKYQVRKIRGVMQRNGDGGAKLRITELGWGSARRGNLNLGRKGQARMLRKSFGLLERNRRSWNVKGVNWFSFQDNPAGGCSFCPTSGLFEADRDPKPSWRAFKRAARR